MALQDLHKTSLRRCFNRLVEDLDPRPVLDRFHEKDFLPYTVIRDIEETAKTSDKNKTVIDKVMNKGPEGYKQFKQILKDTHQEHLAEHLTSMEKTLQEEAKQKSRREARDGAPSRPQHREGPQTGALSRQQQQAARPRAPGLVPSGVPAQGTGAVSQTGHAATTNLATLQTAQSAHGTQSTDTWQQHRDFLSDKYLLELADDLGVEWYNVGINLGMKKSAIDQIGMNNPHSVAMQIVTTLTSWRDSSSQSNLVEDLIEAFKSAPRQDLALKVKQDFERRREEQRIFAQAVIFSKIEENTEGIGNLVITNEPTPTPTTAESLATNTSHQITGNQLASLHSFNAPMGNTRVQDPASGFVQYPDTDLSRMDMYDGGSQSSQSISVNPDDDRNRNAQMTTRHDAKQGLVSPINSGTDLERNSGEHHYDSVDSKRLNHSPMQSRAGMDLALNSITQGVDMLKKQFHQQEELQLPLPVLPTKVLPTNTDDNNETTDVKRASEINSPNSMATNIALEGFEMKTMREKNESPFEGRIIDISLETVKKLIGNKQPINRGGYGEVYECNEITDLEMKVVIKKIDCKDDMEKRRSATNELLAARVMHFGIVPLLAMADDTDKDILYFMFPYLENNDLRFAINKDVDNLKNRKAAELTGENRLKILFQIAATMKFLHTEVEGFRGSIIHRDITSRNIVLDGSKNARLLDFGLSRGFKEGQTSQTMTQNDQIGTYGYFTTCSLSQLTQKTDCLNFGVVILELLTGKEVATKSKKPKKLIDTKLDNLDKYDNFEDCSIISENLEHVQAVWGCKSRHVKALLQLAHRCLKRDITTSDLFNKLEELMRSSCFEKWTPSELKKCVICMVNPAADTDVIDHSSACNLKICMPCMRNSYLNPIQCHTCDKTVTPIIGHCWGALLISGNDTENKKRAATFSEELQNLHKTFVSKHPLIMGIREKNVHCISPTEPGKSENLGKKIIATFETVKEKGQTSDDKEHIDTLVIYFNGHCKKEGFVLGNNDEILGIEEVKSFISDLSEVGYKKFIVLLDCCMAPGIALPDLSGKSSLIQLNASKSNETALATDGFGSPFTKFLIQGLTGKAFTAQCSDLRGENMKGASVQCDICKKYNSEDGLISVDQLQNYIESHMNKSGGSNTPTSNISDGNMKATKIAYFIKRPVKVTFYLQYESQSKEKTELERLPETMKELTDILLRDYKEKFSLPDIDITDHSEILSVSVNTGPKDGDVHELNTIEKIVAAWNGKQQLYAGLRAIENIENGKVGIIEENQDSDFILSQYLKHQDTKQYCQVRESETENKVYIKLTDLSILHPTLSKCLGGSQTTCEKLNCLKTIVDSVRHNTELESLPVTHLLIRVPKDLPKFLSLEVIADPDLT